VQAARAAAERIFGLLDRAPAITPPARPAAPAPRPEEPAVELRGVWAAYEGEHWVLRDCALAVARGERVALVGATGEGKSTIARLLNRSYEAPRGCVRVDGVDVRGGGPARPRRAGGIG